MLNLSNIEQLINIEESIAAGNYRDIFTKEMAPSDNNITMEPWSYLVLEKL